jgi:hypothetical protein
MRFALRWLAYLRQSATRCADLNWRRFKHWLRWHALTNPASVRRFKEQRLRLDASQLAVLSALSTAGIALTSVASLDIPPDLWEALAGLCDQFASEAGAFLKAVVGHNAALASHVQMTAAGLAHNAPRTLRFLAHADKAVTDDYLVKLHDANPTLDVKDPLLSLGLNSRVLNIVNSYFGMWSKLIYSDAWFQINQESGPRIGSQPWHRDPDDSRIVKVYLYLSDVAAESGAMQYVAGSCNRLDSDLKDIAMWRAAGGCHYPATEDVERRIPQSRWLTAAGPRGTLVFCDTTGLHRGNFATGTPRVAATWTYVSPASFFPRRFNVSNMSGIKLSDESRFSIS